MSAWYTLQTACVLPACKLRRRTASDATWKNRPRIVQELDEEDYVNSGAIYRVDDCRHQFMAGTFVSMYSNFKVLRFRLTFGQFLSRQFRQELHRRHWSDHFCTKS